MAVQDRASDRNPGNRGEKLLTTIKQIHDPENDTTTTQNVTLGHNEGNRPSTNLARLRTVLFDGQLSTRSTVTAGNSSQLSDGASAYILMGARESERRPLGSTADSPSQYAHPTKWA
ncbi:hypothetical protein ACLMAL_28745 [Nocardia sp. CWNU-33]|uniref:thiolase family protein n=1 Tax=Nocardia sp. CWNU-33 TaxID=3392117 RepID=UPI00398E6CCA